MRTHRQTSEECVIPLCQYSGLRWKWINTTAFFFEIIVELHAVIHIIQRNPINLYSVSPISDILQNSNLQCFLKTKLMQRKINWSNLKAELIHFFSCLNYNSVPLQCNKRLPGLEEYERYKKNARFNGKEHFNILTNNFPFTVTQKSY